MLECRQSLLLSPSLFPSLAAFEYNGLGSEICKEGFANDFNQITPSKINDHRYRQLVHELRIRRKKTVLSAKRDKQVLRKKNTYSAVHLNNLQPPIELGNKIGCATEGHTRCAYKAPPERSVLADTFAEGATLKVDGKSGDLLRKAKEVNGGIEKGRLKLGLQVDWTTATGRSLGISR